MAAQHPDGRSLVGPVVRLDPTVAEDCDELFAVLDDAAVWSSGYGGGPSARPTSPTTWAERIGDHAVRMQYTVRLVEDSALGNAGAVVGTTTLADIFTSDERIHLGWTAYTPSVWATQVNPATKLLVLGHAFDDLGFGRVKIQCDAINDRSAAAIAKLGATREGLMRRHVRRPDGSFRDTLVFSILQHEWPAVAMRLRARIS